MKTISPEIPVERRPYFLEGKGTAVLVLHGFMGSPKSSRPMAEYLNSRGMTVHCPLLPGHGHLPSRLHKVSHREWLGAAEQGFERLAGACDEIFVVAHSMGSVLAAHLAEAGADVKGVVMLAPLYEPPKAKLLTVTRALQRVLPWMYPIKHKLIERHLVERRLVEFDPSIDLDDPEVQANIHEWTKVPTSAFAELSRITALGRRLWPAVSPPTMILQGEQDEAVEAHLVERIFEAVPDEVELKLFPESRHELMRPDDPAHRDVWGEIEGFIRRWSGGVSFDAETQRIGEKLTAKGANNAKKTINMLEHVSH